MTVMVGQCLSLLTAGYQLRTALTGYLTVILQQLTVHLFAKRRRTEAGYQNYSYLLPKSDPSLSPRKLDKWHDTLCTKGDSNMGVLREIESTLQCLSPGLC